MALNLTAAVLVLAMTFMHSIWGLFSGLLHVFCAIVALAVSFGFSEAIGGAMVKQLGTAPGYTEASVMILLFFAVMLTLRLLADTMIRGNLKVPQTLDWAGGAVCGFIGAEIVVGVLLVSIFQLPLGDSVLGFQRYPRNDNQSNADHSFMPEFERASVWFKPDDFAAGLFSMVSSGSLKGETEFSDVYPNYADWLAFTGNTVQPSSTPAPYRNKQGDGYRRGLNVQKWWEEDALVDAAVYRRELPTEKRRQPPVSPQSFSAAAGKKLIGVRVELPQDSADRYRSTAIHLFRPTMIRIVGDVGSEPAQFPACAVRGHLSDGGTVKWRITDYDNNIQLNEGAQTVDFAFEVPKSFEPRFVEYRRRARGAIPRNDETARLDREPGVADAVVAAAEQAAQPTGVDFDQTFAANSTNSQSLGLPFEFAESKVKALTVEGESVVEGRLTGAKERFVTGRGDTPIRQYKVPDDTKTLIQVRFQYDKVKTIVGQVLNFVDQIKQFELQDANADRHIMVGCWAELSRGGKPYIEFVYDPDPTSGTCDYKQGFLNLPGISRQELQAPGTEICLLFLVPKNCREITALVHGGEEIPLKIPVSDR